jgi:hypothetical protein
VFGGRIRLIPAQRSTTAYEYKKAHRTGTVRENSRHYEGEMAARWWLNGPIEHLGKHGQSGIPAHSEYQAAPERTWAERRAIAERDREYHQPGNKQGGQLSRQAIVNGPGARPKICTTAELAGTSLAGLRSRMMMRGSPATSATWKRTDGRLVLIFLLTHWSVL